MMTDIGAGLSSSTEFRPSNAGKEYSYAAPRVGAVVMDIVHVDAAPDSPLLNHLRAAGVDTAYFEGRLEQVVLPTIFSTVRLCRSLGVPVIFVRPLITREDAGDWPAGYRAEIRALGITPTRPGAASFEFLDGLEIQEDDLIVEKRSVSAFWGANLGATLRSQGVQHVLMMGITTNYGVGVNAVDAANNGFDVTIVEDGCGALTEEHHWTWLGLQDMFFRCDPAEYVHEHLRAGVRR